MVCSAGVHSFDPQPYRLTMKYSKLMVQLSNWTFDSRYGGKLFDPTRKLWNSSRLSYSTWFFTIINHVYHSINHVWKGSIFDPGIQERHGTCGSKMDWVHERSKYWDLPLGCVSKALLPTWIFRSASPVIHSSLGLNMFEHHKRHRFHVFVWVFVVYELLLQQALTEILHIPTRSFVEFCSDCYLAGWFAD